jgi:long-chain-fatty-acid--CoA ligase ACSBG
MSGKGSAWVTQPNDYMEPKLTASGYGAAAPQTMCEVFEATKNKYPQKFALGVKRITKELTAAELEKQKTDPMSFYTRWTWTEYWDDCIKFGKALMAAGVGMHEVINIIGFNSPEWLIANNGAQLAGGIAAGIYSTNSPDLCVYPANHSKAKVVIAEDNKQLEKYTTNTTPYVALKHIVIWNEAPNDKIVATLKGKGITVHTWAAFLETGSSITDAAIKKRYTDIKPGHVSSLIYTSGTTGMPKAVMISHDNITWTANNICKHYMPLGCDDRVVSFLPLSHIAAQIIDIHAMLIVGGGTYFAEPTALKGTLTHSLRDIRPTIFFGVPRVWEKIQEKMLSVGKTITGCKKSVSTWAKSVGAYKTEGAQFGSHGGVSTFHGCANAIAFSKVKDTLGLDQCKACFTAAAPISPDIIKYFGSLDIPVYEVFGQSECTGPHTVSYAGEWKIGSCGRPIYGTETKIDAETKELCYRGRHIFMGYMYEDAKTAETIDAEGWLHSGDIAEFDDDVKSVANGGKEDVVGEAGFMKITGRIKELIIGSGGENIPPVVIENEMKSQMPWLSNCMAVGDKRKYLVMLVSLKCEVDPETQKPLDQLTKDSMDIGKEIGADPNCTTMSAAAKDPAWIAAINTGREAANKVAISNAQKIQKFAMLPSDFSEKDGELTPTMKLKRNVVLKKYEDLIDKLYGETVDGTKV